MSRPHSQPPSFSSFVPSFNSFPDLDGTLEGYKKDISREKTSVTTGREEELRERNVDRTAKDKGKNIKGSRIEADEDNERMKRHRRREDPWGYKDTKTSRRYHDGYGREREHQRVTDELDGKERIESFKYKSIQKRSRSRPRSPSLESYKHPRRSRRNEDVSLEGTAMELSHANFFSDSRGDPLNLTYGGLHAGDIPRYNLVNRGRYILGLPSIWVATRRNGKIVEVGLAGTRKLSELTDSGVRSLLALSPKFRISGSQSIHSSSKYEEVDGFISISSRGTMKIYEQQSRTTMDRFVNLGTNNLSSSGSESEEYEGSNGSDSPEIQFSAHEETLRELNQKLKVAPSSVSLWLQLLNHNLSTIPLSSNNAIKARSELSLSIIERGFSVHPNNMASKALLLTYLQAGEEIWEKERLAKEWEQVFSRVGGIDVWMEWLEWRWRKGAGGIDGFVQDVLRVLVLITDDEAGELNRVRILWRIAAAFQDAGYYERATALFQAQAEIIFKVPAALKHAPLEHQLQSLEEFWDSGYPRLGEAEASGWVLWFGNNQSSAYHGPAISIAKSSSISPNLDPYTAWAQAEIEFDERCRLPLRPDDDEDGSDPYTAVIFTDIKSLLVPPFKSISARRLFRYAWLSLLGLHIPGTLSLFSNNDSRPDLPMQLDENRDDRWAASHFIRQGYRKALFPLEDNKHQLTTDSVAGALVGRVKTYSSSFGPVKNWPKDALHPLDVGLRDEGLGKTHGKPRGMLWDSEDMENLDKIMVKELFAQLKIHEDDDLEWDILSLTFEAASSGLKSALRRSKSLLSQSTDSAPLWGAHAQLERIRGRLDEARKVYSTVLMPLLGLPLEQSYRGQLWWDWAEMEWLSGRNDDALAVILRSASIDDGKGGTVILRAKRLLRDIAQSAVTRKTGLGWKNREAWIKLAALLEILTGGGHTGALTVFDEYIGEGGGDFSLGNEARESLEMAMLLMLYRYGIVLNNAMPTSVLRTRVERAFERYPSNSILLGLFLEGEKGQGIWGKVREEMGEGPASKVKGIWRRVEELWMAGWERSRWKEQIERVRSNLAAAVIHERTRGSAVLWRLYIEFEVRTGQLARAKQVLFQAIHECPLHKDLYLVAFGPLRSVFDQHELESLEEAMAERGIRMRRGLVDAVGIAGQVLSDMEDNLNKMFVLDSGLVDEVEANACELRRLRPY